jgi:hypothetical protein
VNAFHAVLDNYTLADISGGRQVRARVLMLQQARPS